MRNRLLQVLVIVALLALIVARFLSHNSSAWISFINYICLIIALFGFLMSFSTRCKKCTTSNFIKGIIVLVIIVLVIIACFIYTGLIVISSFADDIFLLVTLLISLPSNLYLEILEPIMYNHWEKEKQHAIK